MFCDNSILLIFDLCSYNVLSLNGYYVLLPYNTKILLVIDFCGQKRRCSLGSAANLRYSVVFANFLAQKVNTIITAQTKKSRP